MPRYFTTYWKNDLWQLKLEQADGQPFRHTSSNEFRQKDIKPGDFVYVVTVIEGRLFLAGRIEVERIATQSQAESLLGKLGHVAEDHLLARMKGAVPFNFECPVPLEITKRLQFIRGN